MPQMRLSLTVLFKRCHLPAPSSWCFLFFLALFFPIALITSSDSFLWFILILPVDSVLHDSRDLGILLTTITSVSWQWAQSSCLITIFVELMNIFIKVKWQKLGHGFWKGDNTKIQTWHAQWLWQCGIRQSGSCRTGETWIWILTPPL